MTQVHTKNVGYLVLAQACFLASSMSIVSFASLAGEMLASNPAYATLPVALTVVASALTTGPVSMLMHRTSRRFGFRLGAFAGVLAALLSALGVYLGSFSLLCAGALLMGPFHASAQYYRFAAAESVPADKAPRAISLVLVGGLIAALFVPSLLAYFNALFMPFTFMGVFIFIALVAALALVPLSLLKALDTPFSEHVPSVENGDRPEDRRSTGIQPAARSLGQVVRTPVFLTAMVNGAAGYAMMSFMMTSTPLAMAAGGFGTGTSTYVIQGHVIAMFLPSLFTGQLIMRFGIVPVLIAGHMAFAAAFATALAGTDLGHFATSLVFLGLGWNFCFVGGSALLTHAHSAAEKGKVQGLNEFIVATATATGSLTSGVILRYYGWDFMNKLAFAVLVLAVMTTILYAIRTDTKVATQR